MKGIQGIFEELEYFAKENSHKVIKYIPTTFEHVCLKHLYVLKSRLGVMCLFNRIAECDALYSDT